MRISALGLLAGAVLAVGCANDAGDTQRFCDVVTANRDAIVGAPETVEEIDEFVGLYQRLAETAPLSIEREWDALVLNYETASTVDPADPESLQRVVTQAVRTERSAVRVRQWLLENCAVDLGEPATMAAAEPPPPTPTATAGG
jgi:hypothetical protein